METSALHDTEPRHGSIDEIMEDAALEKGPEESPGLNVEKSEEESDTGSIEEEEEETDEEEERQQFGIYQCLPVDDQEPDFESGDPIDAEEYLRRVRWEAAGLPVVVSSGVDPRQFDNSRTAYAPAATEPEGPSDCRPELQPSTAWLRDFLTKFAALRRQLQQEYEQLAGQQPAVRIWGLTPPPQHAQQTQQPSLLMPELHHLRGLDQVTLVQRAGAHLRRVVRGEGLTPQDAAWLYAYSARIEKPLLADTCALYRALLRHCARLRAVAAGPDDPLLPHLNILIAIAGGYFGQDEALAAAWEEDDRDYS